MRTVRNLRITTLAENTCGSEDSSFNCLGQWGLSFLLEFVDERSETRKIVFDTGMHKHALLHNIKELKTHLRDVDCIVLSHGHVDHTSATVEITRAAASPIVYAHPHTFLPRFWQSKKGKRLDLGVPKGQGQREIERAGGEILFTTEPTEVVPGVWTTGQIERTTGFERPLPLSKGERTVIILDGKETDDQILDDQALWMNVDDFGPLVITGCAHAGTANTILQIQELGDFKQIRGLVGGTHLVERSDEYIQKTITKLKRFGLHLVSPCHCTGFKGMALLMQAFPQAFVSNFSGRVIDVGKETKNRTI